MGKLSGGAFDEFSGKVGNLVASNWKGINVIKRRPKRRKNKKLTEAQLDQQAKFALVCEFLHPLTPLLNVAYKRYTKEKSAFNSAMAYALEHSITGSYPDYKIDWPNMKISRGSLPIPHGLNAKAGPNIITFAWSDENIYLPALPSDRSIAVLYCEEMKEFAYTWTGSIRNEGITVMNVSNFKGKAVHTWMSFMSDDGARISNSLYTGVLIVQ